MITDLQNLFFAYLFFANKQLQIKINVEKTNNELCSLRADADKAIDTRPIRHAMG